MGNSFSRPLFFLPFLTFGSSFFLSTRELGPGGRLGGKGSLRMWSYQCLSRGRHLPDGSRQGLKVNQCFRRPCGERHAARDPGGGNARSV